MTEVEKLTKKLADQFEQVKETLDEISELDNEDRAQFGFVFSIKTPEYEIKALGGPEPLCDHLIESVRRELFKKVLESESEDFDMSSAMEV